MAGWGSCRTGGRCSAGRRRARGGRAGAVSQADAAGAAWTPPAGPLPPPLTSDAPGTWAHDTMSRRIRSSILEAQVVEPNRERLGPAQLAALAALDAELAAANSTALRPIAADGGPDAGDWAAIMAPHVASGDTWLSAPWVVAEFYFYRRVLEALGYFAAGGDGGDPLDPFEAQKLAGLASAAASIEALAEKLNAAQAGEGPLGADPEALLKLFVSTALWGNRMDLSLWPASSAACDASGDRAGDAFAEVLSKSGEMLLADDSEAVWRQLEAAIADGGRQVDIVVDNAGFELVCDLCLGEALVAAGAASRVVFHLKGHPTFVSDAMAKDVRGHFAALRADAAERPASAAMAARWEALVADGRWELREDFFWAQPTPFWAMPARLAAGLEASAMVFVKGDANYRRLLGERDWPYATPFREVVCYFAAPVCALRTLKAEIGCGMPEEKTAAAAAEDGQWLVSGRYGVIQSC